MKRDPDTYIETLATPMEIQACLSCSRKSCPGHCDKVKTLAPKPKPRAPQRRVRCVETGVVYENVKEAAASVGVTASSIYYCLRRAGRTCGGRHWEYAEEGATRYRVECVETGQRFASLTEAARSVGVIRGSIEAHLRGDTETCGGFHWRRIDKEEKE